MPVTSPDCVLNAGFNHLYPLMAGGLIGLNGGGRPQAGAQGQVRWQRRLGLRVRTRPPQSVAGV